MDINSIRPRGEGAYLNTVGRIEPDVSPLDRDGALASIAISLKRIADLIEREQGSDDQPSLFDREPGR